MSQQVEPLRPADLPDREKSIWQMAGPGAIMLGLAVGSGELVLWPWIVARFGASMAWAPIVAVFFQIWFALEVGRWAIATGESALRGIGRYSMKIVILFMACNFVLTMLSGWSRAIAETLRYLCVDILFAFGVDRPWGDDSLLEYDWIWTVPVTLALWLVLLGPKRIYDGVEKVVSFLVIVIIVGVVIVAFKLGTVQQAKEMASGMITPRITLAEDFTFLRLYGASVFAGAGGFGILFYAHYLRDKGIGMGQRFPMLTVDIRGTTQRVNETGYIFSDTPENRKRFRAWNNFVIYDTVVIFGAVSIVSLILFMFAAFAALYPKEQGFSDGELVWALSDILGHEDAMGRAGSYLFLIITMAAIFSTIIGNTDGGIRIWTDMFHTAIPSTRKWSPGQMYAPILFSLWLISASSLVILEFLGVPLLDFFFVNATINGIAMAIFAPVVLYLNLKYLPKFARPGPINIFMVLCGTLLYGAGGVYVIWEKIAPWIGS